MEDLIKDYLWYDYEGKIIYDTFNKNVPWGKSTLPDVIKKMKKIIREEDIREFYKIDRSIYNVSLIAGESWTSLDYILKRYYKNKKENEEHYIDDRLLEYLLWNYKTNLEDFKHVLNIYEKENI